ncbi:MAG: hypothetical protein NVSMB56_04710 [Pyrinomonadaceae bacterium]
MFRLIHRLKLSPLNLCCFICLCSLVVFTSNVFAQRKIRKASNKNGVGGAHAVVIDEHLAALRDEPRLNALLLKRLGRGRDVFVNGARRSEADGVTFYRVMVTKRTGGWLQVESVAVLGRAGEDARLLKLIQASQNFERIARARIFLDSFARSPLRPAVLLLLADSAEDAATKLTRDAARKLKEDQMTATNAPRNSYMLNFNELDRYNRQGVNFTYDQMTGALHYDGAAWREILRRFPRSAESAQAREKLKAVISDK